MLSIFTHALNIPFICALILFQKMKDFLSKNIYHGWSFFLFLAVTVTVTSVFAFVLFFSHCLLFWLFYYVQRFPQIYVIFVYSCLRERPWKADWKFSVQGHTGWYWALPQGDQLATWLFVGESQNGSLCRSHPLGQYLQNYVSNSGSQERRNLGIP